MANWSDEQWDPGAPEVRNHWGAIEFAAQLDQYIARELEEGTLLGPFQENTLSLPLWYPLKKKDSSDRQVIMDVGFPPGDSDNDMIPKDSYVMEEINLHYPSVDAITELIREKKRGCALMEKWT